jgi:glycosyltransferase involved in cell wall biosynthesis
MISVVIPTRNDPEVFDAIESVREQSQDHELIVVDASTGSQKESLESFCNSNDIDYFYQPDHDHAQNLNGARNLGIGNSSGDIIALLDGDCRAEEGWLDNLLDYFENHDIVECNVEYTSDREKSCPMDRVIENDGLNYSFLGAGLAFKREVWDDKKFDEEITFHDDTAFGLDALTNNYSYTYGERARILHDAGRFTVKQFLAERLRFEGDALFFKKYSDHERFDEEINHFGRVLYPKELAVMTAMAGFAALGLYNGVISIGGITAIMLFLHFMYLRRENDKRELDFCPRDSALLFFLVPITLFVKRYAIWKGALKNRVAVF